MKIVYLKILNYRNLCGQEIHFNPDNNFIVGENNLGKSNLLSLLNTVFRNTYRTGFQIEDFKDEDSPIEATFKLQLDNIELGHFEDLFDTDTPDNNITIRAIQSSPDDYLEYWHDETSQRISPTLIKCINYLYYDSKRDPLKELTFDKSKGVGRFLNHLVKTHITANGDSDFDFLDSTKANALLSEINKVLEKIKAFKDYDINAKLEENIENLLAKLFLLKDSEDRHLHQSGYGVQFLAVISLFIFEKLLNLGKLKTRKGVFESGEKKSISLVIGLDEPEIHLHPYLQRAMIKYIQKILGNKDADFNSVLKTSFGLDSFIGQSIAATHSPSIILNDYTQIIRFFQSDNCLHIKSGMEITLTQRQKKQLQMQFPFIKEAFFARCVIIVEGESELSSFPLFAHTINEEYDFDELGISVIKAGGKDSVETILTLMEEFKIPCVGIIDKDLDKTNKYPKVKKTIEQDFEAALVKLIDSGREEASVKKILLAYDEKKEEREMQIDALKKKIKKYPSIIPEGFEVTQNWKLSEIPEEEVTLKKLWYLTWLTANKNILFGATIGECLEKQDIPQSYVEVIEEAVILSKK